MNEQSLFLVKVDPNENNNKFYRMIPSTDSFTVEYGRVGNTYFATDTYPISMWHKKLSEKLKKGYVDQTRLVAEVVGKKKDSTYADISNVSIATIVGRLQSMAKQAIKDNYTISSNKVTQQMIDEAQELIGELSKTTVVPSFNLLLIDLFRTIPRKMGKVQDYLTRNESEFASVLLREQDLLDIMRGQVVQQNIIGDDEEDTVDNRMTILDALGLQFFETSELEISEIRQGLGEIHTKFNKAWKVVNNRTQMQFEKYVADNKIVHKKLLWHGSRNENWWSIINTGLVLRPNAVTTGKMFGYGIYFAPSARKSFGYTSYSGSYWAGGTSNVAFMSLFDVAYGKPYDIYSHTGNVGNMTYEALQRTCPGANCMHAHAGQMLRNDEIIVYQENQITIKYIVELK